MPQTTRDPLLRVGVAGWDYADWKGTVYPAGAAGRLDRLVYLGRYVDVIEINSTFYRPVAPRVAESWLRRAPSRDRFTFTAKAHRSWTHEGPADLDRLLPPTLEGLRPLREGGRLGALLVQFPQSFRHGPRSCERLDRLADRLTDWPLVVEVRHGSWESDEAAAWFERRTVGWCAVDQPAVGESTIAPLDRVTAPIAYLRLHGRNVEDWFRPDAGRDQRYDYRYPRTELEESARTARRMLKSASELFVVYNNHFRGQALANALQLRGLVDERPPLAPEQLVATYPDLEPYVEIERQRLF